MNIIFLDIDGVLNTERYLTEQVEGNGGIVKHEMQFNFDPLAMANLKQIVDASNAKIVLSSTWRTSFNLPFYSRGPLRPYRKAIMKNLDLFGISRRIIGITPVIDSVSRGKEIAAWLEDNGMALGVNHVVIIDDDNDMAELTDYLALCSGHNGITDMVRVKALEILKMAWPLI